MTFTHHEQRSPLGTWSHTEWRPPALRDVVDHLWLFDGTLSVPRERVFPSGKLEIIVHLRGRYREVAGNTTTPYSLTCVTGFQTKAIVIEAPGERCRIMGLRLKPLGAYSLFGRALSSMTGLSIDLADVVGTAAAELAERCERFTSPREQLLEAGRWIAERAARTQPIAPAIRFVASEIERSRGAVSIGDLRERTGVSRTWLANTFREQVGVSPKAFARVLRFRHALETIHREQTSLAEVSLEAGYYDQSHFSTEFREHSGLTPREFLAATRFAGSVSLAEPR